MAYDSVDPPMTEYERGWANERAAERAAMLRWVKEDAALLAAQERAERRTARQLAGYDDEDPANDLP